MRGFSMGLLARFIAVVLSLALGFEPTLQLAGAAWAAPNPTVDQTIVAVPIAADATSTADSSVEASPTIVRELANRRTENSKHYLLSNGLQRAVVSEAPVHFRDPSGRWVDINTDLTQQTPGTYRTTAATMTAEFTSGRSGVDPVTLSTKQWSMALNLEGAQVPDPVAVGDTAYYSNVTTDTSLVYQSLAGGLKETIVLSSAQAPSSYTFDLGLTGVSLEFAPEGTYALVSDETREVVAHLGALSVIDAKGAACAGAAMRLAPGQGTRLEISLPASWLHDPQRAFPVRIDPTVTLFDDTYVTSGSPTTPHGTDTYLRVGHWSTTSIKYTRSLCWFDVSSIASDADIYAATFSAYMYASAGGDNMSLSRPTGAWDESTTWNTKPAHAWLASQSKNAPNWVDWSVTSTVKSWVNHSLTNYGLSMYEPEDSSHYDYNKLFYSSQYSDGRYRPKLVIDYNALPANLSALPGTNSGLDWWRASSSTAKADIPKAGRGVVNLSWTRPARAAGYRVYMYDGASYRQVADIADPRYTSWSSQDAQPYPSDTEIGNYAQDYTGDPYVRSATPCDGTQDTGKSVSIPALSGTGVVATDGSYLYVRPMAFGVSAPFYRVGNGIESTAAPVAFGASLPGGPTAFYLDGVIYNGYATTASDIQGIWKGGTAQDTQTVTMHFSKPLLNRATGAELTDANYNVLLATDGDHIYSGAYELPPDPNNPNAPRDGYRIRVYDRNGTWLEDHDIPMQSNYCDGFFSDGESFYFLKWTSAASTVVDKISMRTYAPVNRLSSLSQGTGGVIGGCYDSANDVFWLGLYSGSSVNRYKGPGLDLRDNPNALYKKTPGTTYDNNVNYWFRVTSYNDQGETAVTGCPAYMPTLPNRTITSTDDPRHTTEDLGEFAQHSASALLDKRRLDVSATDLSIASYGPTAELSRSYRSDDTGSHGFAPGWRFNFDQSIEQSTLDWPTVNLVTNSNLADADANGYPESWPLTYNESGSLDALLEPDGDANRLKVVFTNDNTNWAYQQVISQAPVVGKTYLCSAEVQTANLTPGQYVKLEVCFTGSATTYVGSAPVVGTTPKARISFPVTVPSGATAWNVRFRRVSGTPISGTAWFSRPSLAELPNLIVNSDLADTDANGYPESWSPTYGESGSLDASLEPDGLANRLKVVFTNDNTDWYSVFQQLSGWQAGKTYELSAEMQTQNISTAGSLPTMEVRCQGATSQYFGFTTRPSGTTPKQVYTRAFTVPAGTTAVYVRFRRVAGSPISGTCWWSRPRLAETAATYVDEVGERHSFSYDPSTAAYIAPPGLAATMTTTADNGYQIEFRGRRKLIFNSSGKLASEVDRNGNAVTYAPVGDDMAIAAANGQSITVDRDAAHNVLSATYTTADGSRVVNYTNGTTPTVTYFPGHDEQRTIQYTYGSSRLTDMAVLDYPATGQTTHESFIYSGSDLTEARFGDYDASSRPNRKATISYGPGAGATITRTGEVNGTPSSILSSYTWNPNGTMATKVDAHKSGDPTATWSYKYAPNNEVTEEDSPTGAKLVHVVDALGNLLYDYDEAGHRSAYAYESHGDIIRSTDPRGDTTYYTLDANGNVLEQDRVLDGSGTKAVTTYVYDTPGHGQPTSKTEKISDTESAVTTYQYGTSGQVTVTTNQGVKLSPTSGLNDLTTQTDYDAFGNAIRQYDATGGSPVATNVYDLGGRAIASTDASSVVTNHAYDKLGLEIETWRSTAATSTKADWHAMTYDGAGRVLTDTSYLYAPSQPASRTVQTVVTKSYDDMGREKASDDNVVGELAAKTYYDARGNVTREWAEGVLTYDDNRSTRTDFDEYGRETRVYDPGNETVYTTKSYFPDGQVSREDRPDDTYSTYTYDDGDNKVSEVTPNGGGGIATATWRYDVGGRLVSETTADGATTTHAYDLLGRETTADGQGSASTTVYNTLGWVLSSTDPDEVVTSKTYDKTGRVLSETRAGSGVAKTTSYTFDRTGKQLTTTDPDGKVVALTYDVFGRVALEIHTTAAGEVKHVSATYDSLGRVATSLDSRTGVTRSYAYPVNTADPSTETVTYGGVTTTITTGSDGKETTRASTGGATITRSATTWDTADRETAATVAGITSNRTFSQAGQLTRTWGVGFAAAAANADTYLYDAAGRKSADAVKPAWGGDISAAYTYTGAGRLATAAFAGAATAYTYDLAGNLTHVTPPTGSATTLAYDMATSRLTSTTQGTTVTNFGYDTLGQRVSQGPTSNPNSVRFAYTGTGRLASYDTSAGVHATFTYDAAGQRTKSVATNAGVTTTTNYTYDGLSLLNLSAATGTESWSLTYLYDAAGRPYAARYSDGALTTTILLLTTDRGDVVELMDASGNPFAAYRYDAYGNPTSTSWRGAGAITSVEAQKIAQRQVLRYAGYAYDDFSGLYYCSARYYEPATCQFTSKDPAKADDEESGYQYASGDPVGQVDFTGRASMGVNHTRTNNIGSRLVRTTMVSEESIWTAGIWVWGHTYWWYKDGNLSVHAQIKYRVDGKPTPGERDGGRPRIESYYKTPGSSYQEIKHPFQAESLPRKGVVVTRNFELWVPWWSNDWVKRVRFDVAVMPGSDVWGGALRYVKMHTSEIVRSNPWGLRRPTAEPAKCH